MKTRRKLFIRIIGAIGIGLSCSFWIFAHVGYAINKFYFPEMEISPPIISRIFCLTIGTYSVWLMIFGKFSIVLNKGLRKLSIL